MRRLVGEPRDDRALTPAIIRDRAMLAAGYDPETVGAFMRQATETLVSQLSATTTKFYASNGHITDSAIMSDNASRIAAAAHLLSLGIDIMAMKRKSDESRVEKPQVTIDLSGWTVQPATSTAGQDAPLHPPEGALQAGSDQGWTVTPTTQDRVTPPSPTTNGHMSPPTPTTPTTEMTE